MTKNRHVERNNLAKVKEADKTVIWRRIYFTQVVISLKCFLPIIGRK